MSLRELNSVRLSIVESGSGEPLVLVHGSWDDRHVWELIEDDFAQDFRVVSYDRRGHTESDDAPEPGTRRDDEDDLAALITTLELAPANVVANSFGGSIALGLAARRPDLFRSLCAHEPPLMALAADDPDVVSISEAFVSIVETIERGEAEAAARDFVDQVVGPGTWELLPADKRAALAANATTFAGEVKDPAGADIDLRALGAVRFPVLLTGGDESPPFFGAILAELATAIDGAEVRTLPGAGHVPHETHPQEYVGVIRSFVAA